MRDDMKIGTASDICSINVLKALCSIIKILLHCPFPGFLVDL